MASEDISAMNDFKLSNSELDVTGQEKDSSLKLKVKAVNEWLHAGGLFLCEK